MKLNLFDRAPVSGGRRTGDGYFVTTAKIARTGIQIYAGSEVGKPDMPQVRVYRPESEVFHVDTMKSYSHKPVTNLHPDEAVTAANWKDYAAGQTGDEVVRDGNHVRVPFAIMDGNAIKSVDGGRKELSVGYECTLDWTPGKTADGEDYDAIQRGIRANHLALVDAARAGPECRIGDDKTQSAPTQGTPSMTVKVTVDGITIDASEQAAQAIEKLSKMVTDAKNEVTETKRLLDAKDGELAALKQTKDAEIAELKAKVEAADANIDARIEERQATIADAKLVAGKVIDGKGKSTDAIRREAVAIAMGDAAVTDKSGDYITAVFDTLLASAVKDGDPLAKAISGNIPHRATDGTKPHLMAFDEMKANIGNAWKKDQK